MLWFYYRENCLQKQQIRIHIISDRKRSMYKLWRRQSSKPSAADINSKKRQTQFVQVLSQIIKTIRKKEQFYTRVLFVPLTHCFFSVANPGNEISHEKNNIRQHTLYVGTSNIETIGVCDGVKENRQHRDPSSGGALKVYELQNELQSMASEQDELMTSLKGYEEEEFVISKKQIYSYGRYLYTMFVRLLEIFDYCRQKITIKVKNEQEIYSKNWEKLYEENKAVLTESYQNLVYFQNYNVIQLINIAVKKQNHRVYAIIPLKIKKNQISLKPLIRLNSAELRKTHSIDVKHKKQQRIIQIVNKKINMKEKKLLMTEKRLEERKKLKEKPITFKSLYGILNIRIPKTQEGNAFRREMEIDALQRNELIQQERKKWEKRCQSKTYSLKLLAQQKQQIQ